MRSAVLVCLFFATFPLRAQEVLEADTTSVQPTMTRDAKGYQSCGIRVVTGALSKSVDSSIYDFSLTVWEDGTVFAKAGSHSVPFDRVAGWDVAKLKTKLPAPVGFWIARRDNAVTFVPDKYVKADTPGFLIGAGDTGAAIKVIGSLLRGDSMQVALQYTAAGHAPVVSFHTQATPDDQATMQSCFSGLKERMKTLLRK
jgi:hypothetical protein